MPQLSSARYLVPNSITTANIASGFVAILAAIDGNFVHAAWAILAAAVFDLFDGRIARVMNASSRFGEEFDTLSDLLSFGAAPALLYYQMGVRPMGGVGAALALAYLLCVAFRLARFATAQTAAAGFFQGLSSPVAAATGSAYVLFVAARGIDAEAARTGAVVLFSLLAALMVSHVRFPSFKGTNWRSPAGTALLATLAALLALALARPGLFLFPILAAILLVMMGTDVARRLRSAAPLRH